MPVGRVLVPVWVRTFYLVGILAGILYFNLTNLSIIVFEKFAITIINDKTHLTEQINFVDS